MHIGIIAAVFPIIFVGELPDKTMFASLVMSTRGKPFAVWIGAAAAFLVHVVIATTIGVALFHLIPHRALEAVVSFMFVVGGVLAIREARKEQQEEEIIKKETASGRRVVTTAFLVIFLAEWGDLTQILTANLAAHYHSALSVGDRCHRCALGRGGTGRARRAESAAGHQHQDGADRDRRRALRAGRLHRLAGHQVGPARTASKDGQQGGQQGGATSGRNKRARHLARQEGWASPSVASMPRTSPSSSISVITLS